MLRSCKFKRIVIKIGTKVITEKGFSLDKGRMQNLVDQICEIKRRGINVVLVSSGAIGSGMGLFGLKERPKGLPALQACAALGQPHLMQAYDSLFQRHNLLTAQVLLTGEDLNDRKRYLNAKRTLGALLKENVVSIVNENDTVSTDEIKFGDNDKLSSLVANLIEADLLILLSNVDGLYRFDGPKNERALVTVVNKISKELSAHAQKDKDDLGTGGMASKIDAACIAMRSGIPCIIANGKKDNILVDILDSKERGTLFVPSAGRLTARKCWLSFSAKPKGKINVDDGARDALKIKNKSLLSSGIVLIDGEFKRGDIIEIADGGGKAFARGVTNYSSEELSKIMGLKTAEISKTLGYKHEDEAVDRDNLVILG